MFEPIKIFDPQGGYRLVLDRNAYITEQARDKSVLHVGCADYPITRERMATGRLLHQQLHDNAKSLLGIDLSAEGLEILKANNMADTMLMDAENITLDSKYDLIVAGDVLEHMNNPGKFLEKVRGLLNPHGQLIIGVPNAFSLGILNLLLTGKEVTHKDHTFFFSPKSLSELCSRYGLLPVRLIFSVQSKDIYESEFYVKMRNTIVRMCKKLSPSIIMHFKDKEFIDTETHYLWK